LESALKEAEKLKDDYVSTEHILVAMSEGRGKAGELLRGNGVTKERIFKILVELRGNQRVTDQNPEINTRRLLVLEKT